ncbi:unnamed protein product [Parnassius mnemosyne]|uniref:Reverse transcriptase domain-containing protein n=1 Tax=Parnassius mnemosyne TaxID=213953 RepID=A0AAV1M6J0_9NEOP
MLTIILPCILTYIFNFSLSFSCFPYSWKLAHIIPVAKVANPTLPSEFRPISILPFLSKVLVHIVHNQFSSYLNSNNILNTLQSGFRLGHSTTTALLQVTDDIRRAIDQKQSTVLVLLDFSSAFNSVDFDILLKILQAINVSSSAILWFDSYLRGRSQCIRCNDTYSNWCNLIAGVPQGGVLSPLLFTVFINSITKITCSNFHLYADDLQLYRHFEASEAKLAIDALNDDLDKISRWSRSHGLTINSNKSQALIGSSRYNSSIIDNCTLPNVIINGTSIAYSESAKNLGLIIDNRLSWGAYITDLNRKVHYAFHSLKRLQNFLPFN